MDSKQIAQLLTNIETKEAEVRVLKSQLLEAAISDLEDRHRREIAALEAKIEAKIAEENIIAERLHAAATEHVPLSRREAQSEERRAKEMETLTSLWRTGAEDSEISVDRENQLADLLGVPRRRIVWDPVERATDKIVIQPRDPDEEEVIQRLFARESGMDS